MKGIFVRSFGGPEVLKLEEAPDLKAAAGEVLVEIKAVGVNPVEAYIRSGQYPAKPALPYVPGNDGAGRVVAIGEGVSRFKVGDRVYSFGRASGSYANQLLTRPEQLQKLPEHLSFAQGAALGVPYGTAHRALFGRGQARAGERVLIHGASGGVGIAALQLARRAGLQVYGTAGSDAGLKALLENGAHVALDHRKSDYLEGIQKLTQGQGLNLVIEMLANLNLEKDLAALALGGRVVVVGSRGRTEIDPRAMLSRDLKIMGMSQSNATEKELFEIHESIFAGLEDRSLRPLIAMELPLSEAAKAQEEVMKSGKVGKIVLLPEA